MADSELGRPGFTWNFLACSGAKIANVRSTTLSPPGVGQHPNATKDNVPQLDQFGVNSETDLIVITIGGNDAFFEDVLRVCILDGLNCRTVDSKQSDTPTTWEDFLVNHIRTDVKPKAAILYDQIKQRAPNAAVIVMGYPQIFAGTTSCIEAPGVIKDEQEFIIDVVKEMNQALAQAAKEAGVHYASMIQAFADHELCAGTQVGTPPFDTWIFTQAWLHGAPRIEMTPTFPFLKVREEYSMHPNVIGQRRYAAVLSQHLIDIGLNWQHGFFESGMPKNPPATGTP